ncbi:MAG: RDD family protein, partial [Deltaproteobacteria bacterium]|nr:RDD family protein [Deltaproteobacteria bacterium]
IFTIIWTGIFLYLVVHYGATPGKFVLKLRIVDRKCNFLTWPAAIKRKSPYISISLVSLLQMNSAVRTYPGFETVPTFVEIGGVLSQYGGVYAPLALVLSCFIYFDIGVILFNKRKRALHDYIGGSYVITKSSFITVNNKLKATKTFNMDGLRK